MGVQPRLTVAGELNDLKDPSRKIFEVGRAAFEALCDEAVEPIE
jgi:hypothetical protein